MNATVDLVRRYVAGQDSEAIAEHATMRDHALGTTIQGAEAIGAHMAELYEVTFPGASARVRRLHGCPDQATLEFTFSGTQRGPFGGVPPAGCRVVVDMCVIYGISGDRISSIDLYYDHALMLAQLRAAP